MLADKHDRIAPDVMEQRSVNQINMVLTLLSI